MLKKIKQWILGSQNSSEASSTLNADTFTELTDLDRQVLKTDLTESLNTILASVYETNMVRYVNLRDVVRLYGLSEAGSKTFDEDVIDFTSNGWKSMYEHIKYKQILEAKEMKKEKIH